jgi:hypothetical protein
MLGIAQALISVFIDDGDKLRCINAGSDSGSSTRVTFLQRPPLYYVCASGWGEPESVVSLLLWRHAMCNATVQEADFTDGGEGRPGRILNIYIYRSSV